MTLSYQPLLYLFYGFLIFYGAFIFFDFYHIFRYAFFSFELLFMSAVFLAVSFFIIQIAFAKIETIDWDQPMMDLPVLQWPGLNK